MAPDDLLGRLASVDWTGKSEPTLRSQLIMPLLMLLGYGEHTLHRVKEETTYSLKDPTISRGSRRIRLDYQPTVYEERLWIIEAKGTDNPVSVATLGQARDYAIHPEVRAALMFVIDSRGIGVYDPWDEHWDEPLLLVALDEIASRFGEIREVLGVDRVAEVIRRRHFDHLRRALSASVEFGVLQNAEAEFKQLLDQARVAIRDKRRDFERRVREEAEELRQRVLKDSGVWGVAQHHNDPWIGTVRDTHEFADAVLYKPAEQRQAEMQRVWPAIEAVYRGRCPNGAELRRPLWWLHTVLLGSCLRLRGQAGCEPLATEWARAQIRNHLLGFPEDPVAAAAHRLQRQLVPLSGRVLGLAPLDELAAKMHGSMTPEDRIRYRVDDSRLLMLGVRKAVIDYQAQINPWTVERLDEETAKVADSLARMPTSSAEWQGPLGDPWLKSWAEVDPLLMCGLAVLNEDPTGDDLLTDEDVRQAIPKAATGEHELLRRPAAPLAQRLGLL